MADTAQLRLGGRAKRDPDGRSRSTRRGPAWAGVVLVSASALLATGCTGTPNPTDTMPITTPTTTATTTTARSTPSTTTAPPSTSITPSTPGTPAVPPPVANIPPAARPNTRAGAQEFVKYYMNQVVAAWSTANPKLLDGLWDSECEWCSGMVDTATEFQRLGDRYVGSPFNVQSVLFLEQAQGFTVFLVIGEVPKAKVIKADGTTKRTIDRQPATLEITCWYKSHWQATRVKSVGR